MAELREHFHLFAYGTLRRGGASAHLLDGCEWLGAAQVGGVLYDIDAQYNALVLYGNTPVTGDVWRCPVGLLAKLDAYEGVADGLFRRVGVEIKRADGGTLGCWTYVAGPKLARLLVPSKRVGQ